MIAQEKLEKEIKPVEEPAWITAWRAPAIKRRKVLAGKRQDRASRGAGPESIRNRETFQNMEWGPAKFSQGKVGEMGWNPPRPRAGCSFPTARHLQILLAGIIHEGPATSPDLQAITGVLGPRILDVLSSTPAVLVPAGARTGLIPSQPARLGDTNATYVLSQNSQEGEKRFPIIPEPLRLRGSRAPGEMPIHGSRAGGTATIAMLNMHRKGRPEEGGRDGPVATTRFCRLKWTYRSRRRRHSTGSAQAAPG